MNHPTPAVKDEQLKMALAKMLPDKIGPSLCHGSYQWREMKPGWRCGEIINDTEWLNVCWLVEQELSEHERANYANEIFYLLPEDENHGPAFEGGPDIMTPSYFMFLNASWQSRAVALCRVKEIETI